MHLLSSKDLSKAMNMDGIGGEIIAKFLMQLLKFNKLNNLYSECYDKPGYEFVNYVIDYIGVNYDIPESDLERIPKTGPFVTVSNHPYGGVDALLLIKLIAEIRPDFKTIGNFLLNMIEPMQQYVLPVNPFENRKGARSSVGGLKKALEHIKEGNSVGIFPAGEVSTYQHESSIIRDREWQLSSIRFMKKAEVPIVPVYFQGTNSRLFHILGQVHPVLRTAKLPSELFNKKNKTISVRIGKPIPVREQKEFSDISYFGRYLRARTYALGTNLEVKKFYMPKPSFKLKKEEPIVDAVDQSWIEKEIDALKEEYTLFTEKNYRVICAPSQKMPDTIQELGRLREITFREVGEGTNKSIDIDEYDIYYHQMVIWDEDEKKIVGAYRVGKGKDILAQYGLEGFYISTLFKIKNSFKSFLSESIELGRSFIVKEYQRKPLPLFLLWKGILFFLLKNPEYRYMIGPVSISNDFSDFSKSLIVDFIKEYFYDEELAAQIKPRKKFVVKQDPILDHKVFLEDKNNDVSRIDSVIQDIESKVKFPILLKKYLRLNGKIISFNIDPKFNNALDGLLVVDVLGVPASFVKALSKELNDESLLERLKDLPDIEEK